MKTDIIAPKRFAVTAQKKAASNNGSPVKKAAALMMGLLPAVVAVPVAANILSPTALTQKADSFEKRVESAVKTNSEQQTELKALKAELDSQTKDMDIMQKKLALFKSEQMYEVFATRKREAIQRVQAAQFILNENIQGTSPDGKPYTAIGSTAGWVAKDWDGKLMLLGCAHGVKEGYDKNPNTEYEVILGDLKFKTTLAKNMPKGLKPYSSEHDMCVLDAPDDPAIRQKLEKVAIPVANMIMRTIPAGTEALAIGSPLDTIRYVTEGIISDHDQDGKRRNNSQSSQFPVVYTDAGTNSGNSGGPLIAYNWESNDWEIVGSTVAKAPKSFHYAICTPVSAFQAFLNERGWNTVDKSDAKALQRAEEILEPEHGFPLKQKKIISRHMEPVFKDLNIDLDTWLKTNKLTRDSYIEILQPRFTKLAESPQYKDKVMLPFVDPENPYPDLDNRLKEMVRKAILNQS